MYKILIKYTSTSSKTFWQSYNVEEDGIIKEFSTPDLDDLKAEIDKLDKQVGYENIRVINDVTFDVSVDLSGKIDIDVATPEDVVNIYEVAYADVYN